MSIDSVILRINRMKAMTDPSSPEMRMALTRIGTVLQAEIRQNIGRKKIIDYGGLLNSIKYQIDGNTLSVGSYGIKYAAINEFGGAMSHAQVAAMFADLRRKKGTHPKGAKVGKGIVTVNKDGTGYWQPRPFLRPALKAQRQFIIDMIRSIGNGK